MLTVSNTSPLIFLAKVPELIALLKWKYDKIIIPKEVYAEAVEKGISSHNPQISSNAAKIKALVEEGFIKVEIVKTKIALPSYLGKGESAAIALALERKVKGVLIDEKPATSVARSLGLNPSPISTLPIEAFRKDKISRAEAVKILDSLLANNYYLSSRDYKILMKMLEL
ncbi:MAG: hypothetical protein HYW25_05520 [Candidatus Aenigmarchaeota archaeon]|nr:hypothetical protein [Candidatus Aenigmarchaeota archaeon]